MADLRILVYSIIGFGAGLYFFFKGFIWLKQKHMIENVPTSKIRSIAMGLVEIYGKAVPIKRLVLTSPFSAHDCVYYKYQIEELRRFGKSSRWVKIREEEEHSLFYLNDNTGSILVDSRQANIDIPLDFEFNSGFGKDPPQAIKNFLEKDGIRFEGIFGMNRTMRYREYFIATGDTLYIMGYAGKNLFIDNKAKSKNEDIILIQKGHGNFFYISDRPEKDIIGKLKWKVAGGLFGGSILTIVSLIVILLYLRLF